MSVLHRECGTLVELASAQNRAVGKMRATMTQRFDFGGGEPPFDVDCDCRLIFFCQREGEVDEGVLLAPADAGSNLNASTSWGGRRRRTAAWKARFVKLFHDKDKIVPVDGGAGPRLTTEETLALERYPVGYRYLGTMQARLGCEIGLHRPTGSAAALKTKTDGDLEGGAAGEDLGKRIYTAIEDWLEGKDVDLLWEEEETETKTVNGHKAQVNGDGYQPEAEEMGVEVKSRHTDEGKPEAESEETEPAEEMEPIEEAELFEDAEYVQDSPMSDELSGEGEA